LISLSHLQCSLVCWSVSLPPGFVAFRIASESTNHNYSLQSSVFPDYYIRAGLCCNKQYLQKLFVVCSSGVNIRGLCDFLLLERLITYQLELQITVSSYCYCCNRVLNSGDMKRWRWRGSDLGRLKADLVLLRIGSPSTFEQADLSYMFVSGYMYHGGFPFSAAKPLIWRRYIAKVMYSFEAFLLLHGQSRLVVLTACCLVLQVLHLDHFLSSL
jgi:hypothetical protein